MNKYKALVYYCVHLPEGKIVYLTDKEMERACHNYGSRYLWISRSKKFCNSIEDPHMFGVEIPQVEIDRYKHNKQVK